MKIAHTFRHNEAIQTALRQVHGYRDELFACDWLVGSDPIYKGIHPFDHTDDGRIYRNTAHVAYPEHLLRRGSDRPFLFLPDDPGPNNYPIAPWIVIHELGHVLDFHVRFERICTPCTWYASTNRYEAFAEAFTAFCLPWYATITNDDFLFFESLLGPKRSYSRSTPLV